jgi:hypothetical protein
MRLVPQSQSGGANTGTTSAFQELLPFAETMSLWISNGMINPLIPSYKRTNSQPDGREITILTVGSIRLPYFTTTGSGFTLMVPFCFQTGAITAEQLIAILGRSVQVSIN